VAVASVAEELQSQQGPDGTRGWDHLRAGESYSRENRVEVGGDKPWQEQKEATELGAEAAGCQVELANVSQIGDDGMEFVGALAVEASWQFCETLFLHDGGDRRGTKRLVLSGEAVADVVDGEVLFPECDDALAQSLLLAWGPGLPSARGEEAASGVVAELMDEYPKAPRCITEASGGLSRRETVHEEGPQGFVMAMGGVGGFQEPASQR